MPSPTYVLIARIPPHGIRDFQEYEASVLPLLSEHGATLERRLRGGDGCFEVHVLRFPSADALTEYRSDPRRTSHAAALERSGATIELHLVADVPVT